MADTIFVKSNQQDNRLALSEEHPDHPGGEVFVYGDKVFEVAKTAKVQQALARKALVEVDGPKKGKAAKDEKDDKAE